MGATRDREGGREAGGHPAVTSPWARVQHTAAGVGGVGGVVRAVLSRASETLCCAASRNM